MMFVFLLPLFRLLEFSLESKLRVILFSNISYLLCKVCRSLYFYLTIALKFLVNLFIFFYYSRGTF